jgi:hypothetical protein
LGWRVEVSVVAGLELVGWDVVEGAVQASAVVPVDPFGGDPFHVGDGAQGAVAERAVLSDGFVLEQPDRGLGQCVDAPIVVNS